MSLRYVFVIFQNLNRFCAITFKLKFHGDVFQAQLIKVCLMDLEENILFTLTRIYANHCH